MMERNGALWGDGPAWRGDVMLRESQAPREKLMRREALAKMYRWGGAGRAGTVWIGSEL